MRQLLIIALFGVIAACSSSTQKATPIEPTNVDAAPNAMTIDPRIVERACSGNQKQVCTYNNQAACTDDHPILGKCKCRCVVM